MMEQYKELAGFKDWLALTGRQIRMSNPRASDFRLTMANHLPGDVYTGGSFLNVVADVFPANCTISEKLAFDTWSAWLFYRSIRNAKQVAA